ncbi:MULTISPECIES: YesL family protein [unclassified Bifidobacterium]|uniref:YesL family protein n=1 Tax=unclassified Bifidobacterium TaxID=2608897 RepID=UPI002159B1C5|nr:MULTISPECIES: DUF624 domain-containing protein [unclassified Bifidobacterium]
MGEGTTMQRFAVGYEFLCRIIMMLMVCQVAFIVHTVMGLVVGGFFPSVAALYATFRTWLLDVKDRSWTIRQTWTTFHRAWKSELASANLFGWPQTIVWALLVWDYYLVNWNDMGVVGYAVSGVLLLVNVLYGLFVLVSWTIRANFDEGPWWVVRTSVSMVIARPWCSCMVVALLVATVWLYHTWPGLGVALGVTAPVFAVMMAIYSYGRLPGMDIHVLEPVEEHRKRKQKRNDHE